MSGSQRLCLRVQRRGNAVRPLRLSGRAQGRINRFSLSPRRCVLRPTTRHREMPAIATATAPMPSSKPSKVEVSRLRHQEPVRNKNLYQPGLFRALSVAQDRASALGLNGYVVGRRGAVVAYV